MADVAQILGVNKAPAQNSQPPAHHQPSRAMQKQGLAGPVVDLLSGQTDRRTAELPPQVPGPNFIQVSTKKKGAATTTQLIY